MRDAIADALEAWSGDGAVRVVVLTGSGPSFSSGFDLDEFADAALAPRIRDSSRRYHLTVWQFPKPLIAAVDGAALGGRFDLCLMCDLRLASSTAVFGHPEIKFGAPPLFTPLQWIVGAGMARDLCLTGRRIDAREAHRIGLVSRVVDPDRLLEEALGTARTIAEAPQAALGPAGTPAPWHALAPGPREPQRLRACRSGEVEDRPPADSELVARARRGERRAFERLVELHQTTAFRTAWLITGSASEAEDAAQEAFVKAYRALGRFREGAPFRPWLLAIVANEARNQRAAGARRERLALRVAQERRPGDAVPSPEAALLGAERRAELLSAVERLGEEQRLALACRYFLELSEEETAAALGCRRGTVKSRVARALARLREELEEERVL
jgi:enoyl-CoA hydratase